MDDLTRRDAIRVGIAGAFVATGLGTAVEAAPGDNPNLKCLGMVSLKSRHNAFLQAYTEGELHASNKERHEEETWLLWEVDGVKHIYALQNYRTGAFLAFRGTVCAEAKTALLGPTEKWLLLKGAKYGIENAVAIQSVESKKFLGAHNPGRNTECGGEVGCGTEQGPPENQGGWPCWWVMAGETRKPTDGTPGWIKDFEKVIGKTVELIPAAVGKLLEKL